MGVSMMSLPIRATNNTQQHGACSISVLNIDDEQHTAGIPWLHGELDTPASEPLRLVLRIYNQTGIPIIEGQSNIAAGDQQIVFQELYALGIEAYAHTREAERVAVAQRVWSRRRYGIITVEAIR
jgi:hypothetical protein